MSASKCCPRLFRVSQLSSRRGYASESNVTLPKHPPLPKSGSSSSSSSEKSSPAPSTSSSNAQTEQDAPPAAVHGDTTSVNDQLKEVVSSFEAPVRFAVGYGSGVFKQAGRSDQDKPMLDFLFGVSHPAHWHAVNKKQNPDHYAWLPRALGSTFISYAQEHLGAGLWFNIDCPVAGRRIKYGVISLNSLCTDLLDWNTLYVAGRLHKPTAMVKDNARVRLANQVNHASALRAALLMLPARFTPEELFTTVTALSYTGDPRMGIAENPDKVRNIVRGPGSMEAFNKMYSPFLPQTKVDSSPLVDRQWTQNDSPRAKAELASKLPRTLKEILHNQFLARGLFKDTDPDADPVEVEKAHWHEAVSHQDFHTVLTKSLEGIVAPAAFRQSLKGAISVGPVKGVKYVWPKIQKRLHGDAK